MPKIHILFKFAEGPWGGGNQFLKALRDYFRKECVYSEDLENADVILFNSHHCLEEVFRVKKKYPNKILIHRVAGPIFHARGKDKIIDEIIFQVNDLFADGTIFQSTWSRRRNYEIGMKKAPHETVIMNAPDSVIFNSDGKKSLNEKKIGLIAVSWSPNIRKGFDIYKFLDEHLDFNKYEMTFVGNSPINFKNIKWIKPISTKELAGILKEHDIHITASRYEACSNTLIEALHCGLPAIALNNEGNSEIIGNGGMTFKGANDVLKVIDQVSKNLTKYRKSIDVPNMNAVGTSYYNFCKKVYDMVQKGSYKPKKFKTFDYWRLMFKIYRQKY